MREKYFRFTIQSGSAKVYNCHKVTQEIDRAALKDRTQPKHLFSCIGLNKAVIIKVVDPTQAREKQPPGRVLTRDQLIDRVWGSDYVGDTKTLDVHVKRLRAKIEIDPGEPKLLVTVRGLGYKLEA